MSIGGGGVRACCSVVVSSGVQSRQKKPLEALGFRVQGLGFRD